MRIVWILFFVVSVRATYPNWTVPLENSPLRRMVVSSGTGDVFVAGKDAIFQLTGSNLIASHKAVTGPLVDNANCFPSTWVVPTGNCFSGGGVAKFSQSNFNQLLLFNESGGSLLTCGNLETGTCDLHDAPNVEKILLNETHTLAAAVANSVAITELLVVSRDTEPNTAGVISFDHLGRPALFVAAFVQTAATTTFLPPNFAVRSMVPGDFLLPVAKLELKEFKFSIVGSFASGNFVYFLSNDNGNLLSQICRQDAGFTLTPPRFNAYMEARLYCNGNSLTYKYMKSFQMSSASVNLAKELSISAGSDVLIGVYNMMADGSGPSALCVVSLETIERKYKERQDRCRNGEAGVQRGFRREVSPFKLQQCSKVANDIWDGSTCAPAQFQLFLEIPDPVNASAFYEQPSGLTSVSAVSIANETVIFAGKSDGKILKLLFNMGMSSTLILMIMTPFSLPIKDLKLTHDQSYLFALTDSNVTRIPVQECASFADCSSCLSNKDPFCGHCTLENKCSDRSTCQSWASPDRWIQDESKCINFKSFSPMEISVSDQPKQIEIEVSNVPNIGAYRCVFGSRGETAAAMATLSNGKPGFQCNTPSLSDLDGKAQELVNISLRSIETDHIVTTSPKTFKFFDCSTFSKCFTCTNATMLNCGWCSIKNTCTSSNSQCIAPLNWLQASGKCPQLKPQVYNWPSGISQWDFSVSGLNLPSPRSSSSDGYECEVTVTGESPIKQDAIWKSSTMIECAKQAYSYRDSTSTKEAVLKVLWNDHELGSTGDVELTLYKCGKLAASCSGCLATDSKYQCGWCLDTSPRMCTVQSGCSLFTKSSGDCPKTIIKSVLPEEGPEEGRTNITIKGLDMGVAYKDVNVTVGGNPCTFTAEAYTPEEITCTTSEGTGDAHVVVTVLSVGYTLENAFKYLPVSVSGYSPSRGPMSGGTSVTIQGENLHVGNRMDVWLAQVYCEVKGVRRPNNVDCELQAAGTSGSGLKRRRDLSQGDIVKSGDLVVIIDGAEPVDKSAETFTFTQNPTVASISPQIGLAKGGIALTVNGTLFKSVQSPKIQLVHSGGKSQEITCHAPKKETEFQCEQPSLPSSSVGHYVNITFVMDDVPPESLILSSQFRIVDEPVFSNTSIYPNLTLGSDQNLIVIKGEDLLFLKDLEKQIVVAFGNVGYCNVTFVAETGLTCSAPTNEQFAKDLADAGSRLPITVVIGNYNRTVGSVTYSKTSGGISAAIIIAIVVGVGCVAAVVIIFVIISSLRRSKENKKAVQILLIQMDRMEADMAKECKQGFAELQTDLDVFHDATSSTHVPLLSFRDFARRVFFPTTVDHAVLQPLSEHLSSHSPTAAMKVTRGMDMFRGLLGNKTFLSKMVHTMESEKSFGMRDRVEVASLLMVIFQDQMDYATEVLKMLLTDLIRSSGNRAQPKLLLRRTETVAEKLLTNWLSVCLHQYLEEVAGSPLYTLYLAVKSQIDKGPVDAITGESRYALSEEKLLRQQIDFKEISCSILTPGQQQNAVKVRLLDVDTVSQAKEKCLDVVYKTTGVSSRPALHEVDLCVANQSSMAHQGQQGSLRLRDEDNSTKVDSGWKRVNTLKHYNIVDGTMLVLLPRDPMPNNGKIVDHTQMILASPTRSASVDDDLGPRVWHLIKQVETTTREHQKMVSEIYLTRMLSTKRIIQKFVDDVFDSMYAVSKVPFALKYLYDFLDAQADLAGISDPDVLHTWKNNSVPLRFWMNVIKNPEFVFDVHKSVSVDSFLNIVASTFMDGCSVSDHKLSKESPSSKLLYNKEVQQYKQRVQRYYAEIQSQRKLTENDMKREMARISQLHGKEFHQDSALYQLSNFMQKYRDQLSAELAGDMHLSKSFDKLLDALRE